MSRPMPLTLLLLREQYREEEGGRRGRSCMQKGAATKQGPGLRSGHLPQEVG